MVRRLNDNVFEIKINDKSVNISVDRLKPAFLIDDQPELLQPLKVYSGPKKKSISFSDEDRNEVARGGVIVAPLPTRQSLGTEVGNESTHRRKQRLIPRHDV